MEHPGFVLFYFRKIRATFNNWNFAYPPPPGFPSWEFSLSDLLGQQADGPQGVRRGAVALFVRPAPPVCPATARCPAFASEGQFSNFTHREIAPGSFLKRGFPGPPEDPDSVSLECIQEPV